MVLGRCAELRRLPDERRLSNGTGELAIDACTVKSREVAVSIDLLSIPAGSVSNGQSVAYASGSDARCLMLH